MLKVKTVYTAGASTLENDRAKLSLGSKEGSFYPYDLLLGALSACFRATLYDILTKRKEVFPEMEIIVSGEKRKEVPTTLNGSGWISASVVSKIRSNFCVMSTCGKILLNSRNAHKVAQMSHEVHFR